MAIFEQDMSAIVLKKRQMQHIEKLALNHRFKISMSIHYLRNYCLGTKPNRCHHCAYEVKVGANLSGTRILDELSTTA